MNHKYSLSKASQFGWQGLKGFAFSSKEDFERASAAYFEVDGSHGRVLNKESDRIYFVLEGEGAFDINGEIVHVVKDDVVIVPRATPYDYRGKMKLFLVHSPAFDEKNEVKLEK